MKKHLIIIAALGFAASLSTAKDLAAFQKIYDSETQKIDEKYIGITSQSMDEYIVEIEKLEKSLAAKGDLQGVVAVRKEKKRFQNNRTPTIAKELIVEEPKDLAGLQAAYNEYHARQQGAKAQEISKLTKSYSARLSSLKTSLTKSMKIDEALAVQKEIDRVSGLIVASKTSAQNIAAKPVQAVWHSLKAIKPTSATGGGYFGGLYRSHDPVLIGGQEHKASDFIYAHAPSKIIFSFKEEITGFRAAICLADKHAGNVIFKVLTDEGAVFVSKPITAGVTEEVNLEFNATKNLTLITEINGSINHDHSLWVSPEIK